MAIADIPQIFYDILYQIGSDPGIGAASPADPYQSRYYPSPPGHQIAPMGDPIPPGPELLYPEPAESLPQEPFHIPGEEPIIGTPLPAPADVDEYTQPWESMEGLMAGRGSMELIPGEDPYDRARSFLAEQLQGVGPAAGIPTEEDIEAYQQQVKWPRLLQQMGAIFASLGGNNMLSRLLGGQAASYALRERTMRDQMMEDAMRQQTLKQKILGAQAGLEADVASREGQMGVEAERARLANTRLDKELTFKREREAGIREFQAQQEVNRLEKANADFIARLSEYEARDARTEFDENLRWLRYQLDLARFKLQQAEAERKGGGGLTDAERKDIQTRLDLEP